MDYKNIRKDRKKIISEYPAIFAEAKEVLELWVEELADNKEDIPIRVSAPIIDGIRVAISN